ncbi:5-(carboxyamino)imidazole ribonucleotide synthase [bacterium]|nr:5-(carboxyamino)imidazole ribonucleotide synthase [bacterium]
MRVGILGGGQLGRMLALAAQPLGIHCRVFDPEPGCPAAAVAEHVCAPYDDRDALARFADGLDVATCEIEGLPPATLAALAARVPLRPGLPALALKQDRLSEKRYLRAHGLATAPFASAASPAELGGALAAVGLPAILKRRERGYDGRGQALLRTHDAAAATAAALGGGPLLAEAVVEFARELSVIAVRSAEGEIRTYPLTENLHEDGILRCAVAPAPAVTAALRDAAAETARRLLVALDYVGVLVVELFALHDGRLLVNEIAPRVHNSGHWTIEGAETSQFENHLRALCGLPLGSTAAIGSSFLVNIIGAPPALDPILRLPDTHLHLYGKTPRPGRKIGHVTARALDERHLRQRGQAIVRHLSTTNEHGRMP